MQESIEIMVKLLHDAKVDVNCCRSHELGQGFTPLHFAVLHLNGETPIEMVKLLIDRGADVNAKESIFDQASCLHLVVGQLLGRCEVIKLLLDASANVNTLNGMGLSPLSSAINCLDTSLDEDIDMIKLIIAAGALM
ncbi:hypothetical protein QAD02_018770 [Eretmocerus hayati]|uniref:Uncharacterized protein n=1 Tax=Eretmocerus hayati TaxID=131215 RepID=A0ACC2PIV9_9HYME|nr:hypothetical protein QAD02_018770 [Eretmocerus hayati]